MLFRSLWGSISILVGTVIAILALIRGSWQTWLLIGVFFLWGLWVIAVLLRPCMQQAKRRRMREQLTKKRLAEGITGTQSFDLSATESPEMELLLLRHVNHRISAYLRAVYPDVRWEWCEKRPEKLVLAGGTGRIRLYGIPDFDHADVCVDQNASITCNMLKMVPLSEAGGGGPEDTVPPNKQPVDPHISYVVQGRKVEAPALTLGAPKPVGALVGQPGVVGKVATVLAPPLVIAGQAPTRSTSWMPPSTLAAAFSMSSTVISSQCFLGISKHTAGP